MVWRARRGDNTYRQGEDEQQCTTTQNYKPQLRPVDAFRLDEEGEANIGVRDGTGLSPAVLTMSEAALLVLAP